MKGISVLRYKVVHGLSGEVVSSLWFEVRFNSSNLFQPLQTSILKELFTISYESVLCVSCLYVWGYWLWQFCQDVVHMQKLIFHSNYSSALKHKS
jgi:hypothetical protein